METNTSPDESSEPGAAPIVADIFDELQSDRARLIQHTRAPAWLTPGYGLIAAAYVSAPAFPGEQTRNFILIASLVAGILLLLHFRRSTGVKISRQGAPAWWAFAASVLGTLALFSVSLGLAALGLHWWIAAPACAAFLLVTWLSTVIFSSMRERLRHVR